ncbi:MAG: formylglycine-generating enzyme family protein [Deltaproteobacteria bacterium]|nr:formylglycine-generating enzyme family protein [Deltaproteobacteria bacterium]
MRAPDFKILVVLGAALPLGVAACAEGIEPPKPTAMASVTDGLTFEFGLEGLCKGSDDLTCDVAGDLPLEYPKVKVQLAPFAIDVHEVTNFQYEYCVEKGGCTEPQFGNAPEPTQFDYYLTERYRDYPVVNVTWVQAQEYCAFVGKRLPTEVEWERVAKGPSPDAPRDFPIEGDFTSPQDCEGKLNAIGCGGDQKMERVGASANDFVIEDGTKIYHLAANASEWTDSWYKADVTCLADAPCLRENECAALPSDQQAACIAAAKNCGLCASLSEGECHYMCEGFGRKTILCTAYDEPLTQSELVPTSGSDKAIRGGSVSTTRTQRCLLHSWNRDQRNATTFLANSLGFRCARSL